MVAKLATYLRQLKRCPIELQLYLDAIFSFILIFRISQPILLQDKPYRVDYGEQ
jgi:hypothetical protein